jgi:hypothetical protein
VSETAATRSCGHRAIVTLGAAFCASALHTKVNISTATSQDLIMKALLNSNREPINVPAIWLAPRVLSLQARSDQKPTTDDQGPTTND